MNFCVCYITVTRSLVKFRGAKIKQTKLFTQLRLTLRTRVNPFPSVSPFSNKFAIVLNILLTGTYQIRQRALLKSSVRKG